MIEKNVKKSFFLTKLKKNHYFYGTTLVLDYYKDLNTPIYFSFLTFYTTMGNEEKIQFFSVWLLYVGIRNFTCFI